ncbi:MAG: hypothetical protein AAF483_20270 [Planctomycetota bacterium]
MQEIDQKAAIMIVIEHFGNVQPGTKCSAVFFDHDRIRKQQEFHDQLYCQNGVNDPEVRRAMVSENVPDEPYWLVSLKSTDETGVEFEQLHRVDARTGKVLVEPS